MLKNAQNYLGNIQSRGDLDEYKGRENLSFLDSPMFCPTVFVQTQ